jgi:hypothetical protein
MNYKDVALLNNSLDQLGEGLLHRKMLEMQDSDRKEQRTLQGQRNQIDQQRFDTEKTHWDKMEQAAGLQATFKDMVDTGARMRTGMATLAQQVRSGTDPEVANQYFRDSLNTLPDGVKEKLLGSSPEMKMAYEGDLDWNNFQAPLEKDIKPKMINIGGRDVIYNPATGSPHIQDPQNKWAPEDLIEVRALNNSLEGIDKEARTLASKPDTDRARALNAQRKIAEAKKDKLVQKYSQPGADTGGGAIPMIDPRGNTVNVPAARRQEMLGKGYKEQ